MMDVHTHPIPLTDEAVYAHFEEHGEIPQGALAPFFDAMRGIDRVVALAFWAPASGIRVSNAVIDAVVRHDPDRLVGFASVHPYDGGAIAELDAAIED